MHWQVTFVRPNASGKQPIQSVVALGVTREQLDVQINDHIKSMFVGQENVIEYTVVELVKKGEFYPLTV